MAAQLSQEHFTDQPIFISPIWGDTFVTYWISLRVCVYLWTPGFCFTSLYINPMASYHFVLLHTAIFIYFFWHIHVFSRSVTSDTFVTPWTVVHQAPLSVEFSRQDTGVGVAFFYSRGSFWPRDWILVPYISYIGRQILFFFNLFLVEG